MSAADRMLERLQAVRRVGDRRWTARCPAHPDQTPSLSLREADSGALLVKCWGGCEAHEVVAALGLTLADLFPPREQRRPGAGTPRERKPWSAGDLVHLAAFEATVAALIVGDIAAGREADRDRLVEAAARLISMSEASS
jgi:hypothetical protein